MNKALRIWVLLLPLALGCSLSCPGPSRAAPASGGVLVVGDSLEVLTSPYLHRYLPGVPLTINVKGGYSSIQIFRLFREAYDGSQSVIVFDAGTNDNPAYPQILASRLQAVARIVGDRCMVVPTIHGLTVNGINSAGKNRVVRAFAAARPGTAVPDWAAAVSAHPELMQPDHLHPNIAGAAFRARLIADGVKDCLGGGTSLPPLTPGTKVPPVPGQRRAPRKRRQQQRPEREPPPEKRPRKKPPPQLPNASPVLNERPVVWASRGARLSGELITPGARGRHPAVVMFQRAGGATREAYREQAEYLAEHGIGALIFDKRGSGESTGDPDYSYSQLADDGRAAVRMLMQRDEVDPHEIGVWGLEEGASIAALVAADDRDVAAVVAVSPSVVSPASQRDWAVRHNLDTRGAGEGARPISRFYSVAADAGGFVSARAGDLSFDPSSVWRRVAQPVLAVWGGAGGTVPARASAAALSAALGAGSNRDRSFRTFRGATTTLAVPQQGLRPGSVTGFKELTAAWLETHLASARPRPVVATPLPPPDPVSVRRVADASALERWPVQLAWLVLPACALAFVGARAWRRRRRDRAASDDADAPLEYGHWWWLAAVVALDGVALCSLAYAVASIVEADGQRVTAVAGAPLPIVVAWVLTAIALCATAALTWRLLVARAGPRRGPALTVSAASWAWVLLAIYWLV